MKRISTLAGAVVIMVVGIVAVGGIFLYLQYHPIPLINIQTNSNSPKKEDLVDRCFTGKIDGKIITTINSQSLIELIKDFSVSPAYDPYYCNKVNLTLLVLGDQIDLNNDGIAEYVIFPNQIIDPANPDHHTWLRGASGNGDILVFGKINGAWQELGDLTGNSAYAITTTHWYGYENLLTHSHGSASSGDFHEYRWNGKNYESIRIVSNYPIHDPITDTYGEQTYHEVFPNDIQLPGEPIEYQNAVEINEE